jgi:hypothetical protein
MLYMPVLRLHIGRAINLWPLLYLSGLHYPTTLLNTVSVRVIYDTLS